MEKGSALKILGLDAKASFEDAKKAYRDLAKKYHPDVVKKKYSLESNSESKMKDINLAFRYLAPQLRSKKTVKTKSDTADSIIKEIIESFTNIFFKKQSGTRALKKEEKRKKVIKKRPGKVLFEDVFRGVHKGNPPKTKISVKKKKSFDYYKKYMALKRHMRSVQSRKNKSMNVQRVEKVSPVRPVNPIGKKK